MLARTSCHFPLNTPLTARYYGCKCDRCKEAKKIAQRAYRAKYSVKYKATTKEYNQKVKKEVLEAYGGLFCNCCHETDLCFLSLDHVNNDGYLERRQMKERGSGTQVYAKLRRQGYPDKQRYQVLCMNCNFGKKINGGTCPHKSAIKVEAY